MACKGTKCVSFAVLICLADHSRAGVPRFKTGILPASYLKSEQNISPERYLVKVAQNGMPLFSWDSRLTGEKKRTIILTESNVTDYVTN